jgi:hypothetical protein
VLARVVADANADDCRCRYPRRTVSTSPAPKALPGSALTAAHAGSAPPGRWANGTHATVPTATLKEQVLWIERFDTLDELRIRIREFAVDFQRALAARAPR